jgi:hypothetical protein
MTDAAPVAEPTPAPASLRPYGRSLVDFGELSPGEATLIECCRCGKFAVLASELPEGASDSNRVRADFVRFLALGGDEKAPVHERGVRLHGAWITGPLDLSGAKVERDVALHRCQIEHIDASFARLQLLSLSGSHLICGLTGNGLDCTGLRLDQGFCASGGITLIGATMGILDCTDGRFENRGGDALLCDSSDIPAGAFLRGRFHATGGVRLLHASIGGNLDCGGGRFECGKDRALSFDGAQIAGEVSLNEGFRAVGLVSLVGATIRGSLNCCKGSFLNPGDDALKGDLLACDQVLLGHGFAAAGAVILSAATVRILNCEGGNFESLLCEGAEISGTFFFRGVHRIRLVNLTATNVGTLADDLASWEQASGKITLDGFTYDRLAGNAPTDARARSAWLGMQKADYLGHDQFRTQPWEQLVSVLRAMGHADEARGIAVAKHGRMRQAHRFVGGSAAWDRVYGTLIGYGYRPWKLVRWIAFVWFLCTLAYWPAVNPQWFGSKSHLLAPTKYELGVACLASRAAQRSQEPCPVPPRLFRDFFVPTFSAEVLLPAVSFGYKGEWKPVVSTPQGHVLPLGWAIRVIYWFEIAFGWVAGLVLVAAVGNLIKRE